MLKQLLREPFVVFWLGMVLGLMWTALVFGTDMMHKSIFNKDMVYIDGRVYQIKEIK